MGTAALGEIPYEQVLMHGWALAEDGRKMSKSLGNIVSPKEAIDRHGADPMRLFLLSQNPQGDDMRFSWDEMSNRQRDLNILWNVFRFPLPYMRLDGFDPEAVAPEDAELETIDRWVLSRLATVTAEMTDHWAEFRQDRALEALLGFVVEDVSRFYIQVVRERMWEERESASKQAAYATFHRVLTDVVALLAPFAPFVAEEVYANLTGETGHPTVHMCDWPEPDERFRDAELETDVGVLRGVEEAGANARQQAERKLRWPVSRVVVAVDDERTATAVDRHRDLLADRLNAREIELVGPGAEWTELSYSARADMSVLGPAFGSEASEVMTALNEASVTEQSLAALESAVTDALGRSVELTDEMVEFVTETPEGVEGTTVTVDGEDRGVVYVDTALTEDIEAEGYAREVVRRVQEMRKELDLDIEAEIRVELDVADDRVAELVRRHEGLIAGEVRARGFGDVDGDAYRENWDVEGVSMTIAVEPLPAPSP
jgi:isoleucyl-tRNA synthetase